MMELKLNKESELSFDINIEGSKETPKARLLLEMEDSMELAISGTVKEGVVTIKIPSLLALKEKLSGDNVKGYLEVIVDNNYFIPWEENFSLKEPITVQAESIAVKKQKEIKITLGKNRIVEKNEVITLSNKDFRIPKTNILLESGDKIEVLSESDEGFSDAIEIVESFTIPGTKTIISKRNRVKII